MAKKADEKTATPAEPDKKSAETKKAETISAILASVESGLSLRKACEAIGFERKTFEYWVSKDEQLASQYERARESRADSIFEEIIDIQDAKPDYIISLSEDGEGGTKKIDPAFVTWQKNRIDARKWMLGKMQPKKYGERLAMEHGGPDGEPIPVAMTVTYVDPPSAAS